MRAGGVRPLEKLVRNFQSDMKIKLQLWTCIDLSHIPFSDVPFFGEVHCVVNLLLFPCIILSSVFYIFFSFNSSPAFF